MLLCIFSGTVHAGEIDRFITGDRLSTLVAPVPLAAEEPVAVDKGGAKRSARASMGMGDAHKYLGYSTLALAVAAAVSSSSKDVHKALGYSAAGAATLTCATGFIEYGDYFTMDDGMSKYNIHIAAGAAATAGFIITAVLGGDGKSHGGIGAASAVLMTVPVIILKW
jgi:hypothetical protein